MIYQNQRATIPIDITKCIVIEEADQGYVVRTYCNEDEDGNISTGIDVIGEECEKKNFEQLVYMLANILGFSYDKFSEENVKITWDRKGHKCCAEEFDANPEEHSC